MQDNSALYLLLGLAVGAAMVYFLGPAHTGRQRQLALADEDEPRRRRRRRPCPKPRWEVDIDYE
jgi:hypothetical protein